MYFCLSPLNYNNYAISNILHVPSAGYKVWGPAFKNISFCAAFTFKQKKKKESIPLSAPHSIFTMGTSEKNKADK